MPKPTNKQELLDAAQFNYDRLCTLIDSYSLQEQHTDFPPGTLNRNIRDVVGHLHHWHLLFFEWYKLGMNGEKPAIPAKGHSWKTTPDLNKEIQALYSSTTLSEIQSSFESSHQKMLLAIQRHSDEELFEKKRYAWTGSTSVGAYLISATSSHYDWAFKLIKKAKKQPRTRHN